MKKFIQTIQNIFKIKELRNRILFTLGLLLVYRFGSFVVLPGVIPSILESRTSSGSPNDLLGLINIFTGGAFNQAAVFALGIMPYITASIIIQLLGFAVPYFQRLQQKEGESGRKKLNQITRLLTVAITLVQGGGYLTYIKSLGAVDPTMPAGVFWFSNIIILSTGTVFAMWLGEKITDRGIGNGVSLLITVGIIATLPIAFVSELQIQVQNNLILFVIEIAALFFVVMATVLIVQGVRRIPIQFAKRMIGRGSTSIPASGTRDYIPLKVNASGVMPIIFAQALMFLPATIAQFASPDATAAAAGGALRALNDPFSLPYNIIYFFLVVIFTYVYTALLVNPTQYADYLKRQNAFIPGIKPGKNTAEFIDTVTTRITLPGSIFLGLISVLPAIVAAFGVNYAFAIFFGGTSLLILVAVVLDTLQQIESHLLMRRYDGLVKSGKIKGRSSGGVQGIGASM
jgi:preprotein translocase subunit SecY